VDKRRNDEIAVRRHLSLEACLRIWWFPAVHPARTPPRRPRHPRRRRQLRDCVPHPGYGIAPFEPDKLRHAETATIWGLSRWAEFERGEVPRPY